MGEIISVARHHSLHRALSNPQSITRPAKQPLGRGAVRLGIAGLDAAQVVVLGVLLSRLASAEVGLGRAALLAVMVAALALVIRRGLRDTANLHVFAGTTCIWRASAAVLASSAAVLAGVFLLDGGALPGRTAGWLAAWGLISAAVSAAIRLGPVRRTIRRTLSPRTVVVGPQPESGVLASILSKQGGYRVLSQLSPASPAEMLRLEDLASSGEVDTIVLVGISPPEAERICLAIGDARARICLAFDTMTYMSLNPDSAKALPVTLLPLLPDSSDDWRHAVKRGMDIAVSLMVLPIIAPVLVFAAIAIRLESPGPVFFRQWRFGLGCQPTRVLKFRTMRHDLGDATGEARTLAKDPRVTRVGRILRRTSIDEMPQLFNVLRGDMSLVGPRPHATHMKVEGNYYFEAVEGYRLRHRVKPGITGWAQINGSRGEVDTMEKARERVDKDIWYVRNWSLWLDIRILVRTALGGFATLGAD